MARSVCFAVLAWFGLACVKSSELRSKLNAVSSAAGTVMHARFDRPSSLFPSPHSLLACLLHQFKLADATDTLTFWP